MLIKKGLSSLSISFFTLVFGLLSAVSISFADTLGKHAEWDGRESVRSQGASEIRIHTYANMGDLRAVGRELARGVPVDIADAGGNTALIHAASGGRLSIVKLLLANGAQIDHRNRMGLTALQASIIRKHDETPLYLIRQGADVNVGLGNSLPIISAISAGKPEILRALLDAGSRIGGANDEGLSIWQLLGHPNLVKLYGRNRVADLSEIIQEAQAERSRRDKIFDEEKFVVTIEENGICEVFKGAVNIDSESCSLEARANAFEFIVKTYTWPSGAKTVIEFIETFAERINGQPVTSVQVRGRDCYLNNTTGNTFCYVSEKVAKLEILENKGRLSADPVNLHGTCQQWKVEELVLSYECTGELAPDCGNFGGPCFITYSGEFIVDVTVGWNGPRFPIAIERPNADDFDDAAPAVREGNDCVKNMRTGSVFCFLEVALSDKPPASTKSAPQDLPKEDGTPKPMKQAVSTADECNVPNETGQTYGQNAQNYVDEIQSLLKGPKGSNGEELLCLFIAEIYGFPKQCVSRATRMEADRLFAKMGC